MEQQKPTHWVGREPIRFKGKRREPGAPLVLTDAEAHDLGALVVSHDPALLAWATKTAEGAMAMRDALVAARDAQGATQGQPGTLTPTGGESEQAPGQPEGLEPEAAPVEPGDDNAAGDTADAAKAAKATTKRPGAKKED